MLYRHALCLYPYPADPTGVAVFPPTGLEYVATAMRGRVGRISLVDLRYEPALHALERMSAFIRRGVDLVCIAISLNAGYRSVCRFISQLPGDRTTVVGGREATENVEDVFQRCPNVSAVVRGEGEQTMQELVDGRPWAEILGLSYRQGDRIIHNPNRPLQPIAEILPPDRSLRRTRYFPVFHGRRLFPMEYDTVLSSRGCPYNCRFCTFSLNPLGQKRKYTARPPDEVVDEIAASPGRMIMFADDNFFLEPQRVERICDLLMARGINKRYFANARLEVAHHPRMLEKAYRAGFRMLLLGVESASDRTLKQLGKGFTTKQARAAFSVLRRFPFFYHAYFIYGNVGETAEEMLAIPQFARELGVHAITLSLLRLDKFTPLRELVERSPGYHLGSRGHVYSDALGKKGLLRIRDQIRRRFFWRADQLGRILSGLNSNEILTYPQLARVGLMTPLFVWRYANDHVRRALGRMRPEAALP